MIGIYSTRSGSCLAKIVNLRKRQALLRSAAKKRLQRSKIFLICLVALCGFGCRAEKAQDIRPAERVELLTLDENDPRPYFHAELKFANPEQVNCRPAPRTCGKWSKCARPARSSFAKAGNSPRSKSPTGRQRASWM